MKNLKIPHVFIFLSAIILFSSLLTYIVPSGKFERTTRVVDNVERTLVVPGSNRNVVANFRTKQHKTMNNKNHKSKTLVIF